MSKISLQPSLFPKEKGDFDEGHFMASITQHPQFELWIKLGFTRAYEHLNRVGCSMSKRLRSTNLHEFAFNEMRDSLKSFPSLESLIEINQSKAGNQKNFFSFGGYCFILKKEDSTSNDTQINDKIKHQEVEAHVISVEYSVSPMQDSIISLRLSYYLDKRSVFSYHITLSSVNNISTETTEVNDVTPIKPKLSQKTLDRNAVG
ncbi:MAG: hypothetical protein NC453_17960 [Muribaculum sp.]|nr:hypothetical protein [Muribaculum sp.]